MEKNKRNKIIGLSIGILIVLIIVVSSTYAYWQVTRTQETPNDIVAACLSLDLDDVSESINLDSAWPISDDEASSLIGYTFTVTNNCDEEINYIVGLNRVEESNYLQDSSIKVRLDENSDFKYSDLSDIEYADAENTYTSRVSKQVSVETIGANGTNEHTLRVWVSEDAPVTEQSKIFQGQVFITGGQGIEIPECFAIGNDGTIINYNYSCGTEVKVPAEINGIKVKTINENSFAEKQAIGIQTIKGSQQGLVVVYFDESNKEVLDAVMLNYVCEELGVCGIQNVANIATIMSIEEYNNHDWTQYDKVYYINFAVDYATGQLIDSEGFIDSTKKLETLDLSDSIYLENIGYEAFYGSGALHKIYFPTEGNLTIGNAAFRKVPNLREVTITKSVKHIGEYAFSAYGNYDTIINDTCYWENKENAYLCYGSLEKITVLPDSTLISIGKNAFYNNQLKGTLVIPSTTETIDDLAFDGNTELEVIIKNNEGNLYVAASALRDVKKVTYDPNYTE